jgi:hypothetical protein
VHSVIADGEGEEAHDREKDFKERGRLAHMGQ